MPAQKKYGAFREKAPLRILIAISIALVAALVYLFSSHKIAHTDINVSKLHIINVPNQGLFYVDDKPDVVENHLKNGGWERGIQAAINKYIDPNKNIIDVGAYVGSHTVHMAKSLKNGTIYAFEPQWNIRRKLEGNLMLNRVSNARVFPYALGSKNEISYMKLSPKGNLGGTQICSKTTTDLQEKCNDKIDKSRPIEIRSLDSFNIKNVGFIKIDAEGHELEILKGAQKTIADSRPILIIEIWGNTYLGNTNKHKVATFNYIESMHYSISKIEGHDYLAVPDERIKSSKEKI